MICETHFRLNRKDCFCSNPKAIENYAFAISDENKTWECHHRLETHFSDGTERPKNAQLSKEELIAFDMYYNRPPEELIFLTVSEHQKLHHQSIPKTEEHKRKISNALKGRTDIKHDFSKGRHWYNNGFIEVCEKKCPPYFKEGRLYERKQKHLTEEHKRKISEWNQAHKKERGKAISIGKCKWVWTEILTGETHTMPEWRELGVSRKQLDSKKYFRSPKD